MILPFALMAILASEAPTIWNDYNIVRGAGGRAIDTGCSRQDKIDVEKQISFLEYYHWDGNQTAVLYGGAMGPIIEHRCPVSINEIAQRHHIIFLAPAPPPPPTRKIP